LDDRGEGEGEDGDVFFLPEGLSGLRHFFSRFGGKGCCAVEPEEDDRFLVWGDWVLPTL